MSSVDDFIKELEAKERDLHITSDLQIEVEQSEYDPRVPNDTVTPPIPKPATETLPDPQQEPATRHEPRLKTRVFELEREVQTLEQRVSQLKAERNDIQEKSDRRLKDFESYKYRMDRERRGSFIDQIANLAGAMLPVLDNLDRAVASVDQEKVRQGGEFQLFYDGVALVNQQVNEVLGEMGVEPIKSVAEHFDPLFHEAVSTEERSDVPHNTISEEMLRGYRIGNRVIRHSLVKVTLGDPAASTPATDQDPDMAIEAAE